MHPEQPGNTVDRPTFEKLWHHSVNLLQRGFQSGSILTVDPEEGKRLGPPWTRRYSSLLLCVCVCMCVGVCVFV